MISTSISSNSITVVITSNDGNKVYTIARSHVNYDSVLEAVRNNDEDNIHLLCNVVRNIVTFTEGNVRVENGHVYYGNRLLDGIVVDRILGFIKEKLPVTPLLKFINKLHQNPSHRAITELYKFLEHKNMPITPDGNFLAYKGIQSDYFSKTAGDIEVLEGRVVDGKIFNGVGEHIIVRRNQVCDNKDEGCSKGLHAGSVEYATTFGAGGKVVIVEINPADVVSVPTDCNCQKLRTCAYKVVGEYEVPLNDIYCDDYYQNDDAADDAAADDAAADDAVIEEENVVYHDGFDQGYSDALQNMCFHDEIVDRTYFDENGLISELEYDKVWRIGYKKGYNKGVDLRIKLTDKKLS